MLDQIAGFTPDCFGHNLVNLQKYWKEFLESNIETHVKAEQRALSFSLIAPSLQKRCDFCYSPLAATDVICKSCKANADIKITIKE